MPSIEDILGFTFCFFFHLIFTKTLYSEIDPHFVCEAIRLQRPLEIKYVLMLEPAFKSKSFLLQVHTINHQNLVYVSLLADGWTCSAELEILFV